MINRYIDHTILKNDAKLSDIKRYCEEAVKNDFASVCTYSYYAGAIKEYLKDTDVSTCVVIGFPSGSCSSEVKAAEARECMNSGIDEYDMVINVSALKNKDYDYVKKDIEAVRNVVKNKILKVIVEACLLTEEEKALMCDICIECGADFIKTSTGFSSGGATIEDIKLFKSVVGERLKIKASGGIRTNEFAMQLISTGADRIGAGNGLLLI